MNNYKVTVRRESNLTRDFYIIAATAPKAAAHALRVAKRDFAQFYSAEVIQLTLMGEVHIA